MTSAGFPTFDEPTPIDARRWWTAAFDSYDQRNDDAYYVVTVHESAREVARFVVQVSLYWAGDDWTGPAFAERLRRETHAVASTGRTNTTYPGYGLPQSPEH
jgi:hypothetical protein